MLYCKIKQEQLGTIKHRSVKLINDNLKNSEPRLFEHLDEETIKKTIENVVNISKETDKMLKDTLIRLFDIIIRIQLRMNYKIPLTNRVTTPDQLVGPIKKTQQIDTNKPTLPNNIVLSDVKNKKKYNDLILGRNSNVQTNINKQTNLLVIGDSSVKTTKRALAEFEAFLDRSHTHRAKKQIRFNHTNLAGPYRRWLNDEQNPLLKPPLDKSHTHKTENGSD